MGQAHGLLSCKNTSSKAPEAKQGWGRPEQGMPASRSLLSFGLITLLIKGGKLPSCIYRLMRQKNTLAFAFLKKTGREKINTDQISS